MDERARVEKDWAVVNPIFRHVGFSNKTHAYFVSTLLNFTRSAHVWRGSRTLEIGIGDGWLGAWLANERSRSILHRLRKHHVLLLLRRDVIADPLLRRVLAVLRALNLLMHHLRERSCCLRATRWGSGAKFLLIYHIPLQKSAPD